MKNYLENDEIKENIKEYLKGILEAFGNEDLELVYPESIKEKKKNFTIFRFFNRLYKKTKIMVSKEKM